MPFFHKACLRLGTDSPHLIYNNAGFVTNNYMIQNLPSWIAKSLIASKAKEKKATIKQEDFFFAARSLDFLKAHFDSVYQDPAESVLKFPSAGAFSSKNSLLFICDKKKSIIFMANLHNSVCAIPKGGPKAGICSPQRNFSQG